jgi:hypothetical protein
VLVYRTSKKYTGGRAGTHTGHTAAHTGTRITQTNLTTIQTHLHTRTIIARQYEYTVLVERGVLVCDRYLCHTVLCVSRLAPGGRRAPPGEESQ